MEDHVKQRIEELIASSPVFVFMKGNKLMPQCGFSNNVVQILHSLGVPFETFDVLADGEIRQGIKEYSEWPTIPQVYVKGEFIGGSDILIEMYNSGELRENLTVALAKARVHNLGFPKAWGPKHRDPSGFQRKNLNGGRFRTACGDCHRD